MKFTFDDIERFKLVRWSFVLSGALVAGGWLYVAIALGDIREPLVIYFTSGRGISRIGNVWDLAEIAGVGIAAVAVNFLLAQALERRDWFLGKFVAGATLLFGILIFLFFAVIVSVN